MLLIVAIGIVLGFALPAMHVFAGFPLAIKVGANTLKVRRAGWLNMGSPDPATYTPATPKGFGHGVDERLSPRRTPLSIALCDEQSQV
jgi:hypothetical protein